MFFPVCLVGLSILQLLILHPSPPNKNIPIRNYRYDEDDAGFTSDDDFPDVGEVPEESAPEELPSAAPKVPPKPKAPTPKPAVAKPKAPKARSTSPKAKAKGLPKPQVKPKVEPKLGEVE